MDISKKHLAKSGLSPGDRKMDLQSPVWWVKSLEDGSF